MTRPLSDAGDKAGLAVAAATIRDKIKQVAAAMPSKKIPPTLRSYVRGGIGYVAAGGPQGRTAPNAAMFETEGARHPLFAHGPKGTDGWRNWYDQPYRPFMEEGAEISAQDAAEKFADTAIAIWAKESKSL